MKVPLAHLSDTGQPTFFELSQFHMQLLESVALLLEYVIESL
jgi:hypothetical protein